MVILIVQQRACVIILFSSFYICQILFEGRFVLLLLLRLNSIFGTKSLIYRERVIEFTWKLGWGLSRDRYIYRTHLYGLCVCVCTGIHRCGKHWHWFAIAILHICLPLFLLLLLLFLWMLLLLMPFVRHAIYTASDQFGSHVTQVIGSVFWSNQLLFDHNILMNRNESVEWIFVDSWIKRKDYLISTFVMVHIYRTFLSSSLLLFEFFFEWFRFFV